MSREQLTFYFNSLPNNFLYSKDAIYEDTVVDIICKFFKIKDSRKSIRHTITQGALQINGDTILNPSLKFRDLESILDSFYLIRYKKKYFASIEVS